jgi:hypothetical protein
MTISADAKDGTLDVQLPFTGDINKQMPATAKGPVQIKGSWHCS